MSKRKEMSPPSPPPVLEEETVKKRKGEEEVSTMALASETTHEAASCTTTTDVDEAIATVSDRVRNACVLSMRKELTSLHKCMQYSKERGRFSEAEIHEAMDRAEANAHAKIASLENEKEKCVIATPPSLPRM